ncbi:MAG: hypothetical protein RIS47_1516 [Bacteroidota bacterium]|jgi:aminodeoxyfutalosine synthase
MGVEQIRTILSGSDISTAHKQIAENILAGNRISEAEALVLYQEFDLALLGSLANFIREQKHGNRTYFNRNFHIEPTNVCIYSCTFCSYSRKIGEADKWEHNLEEIRQLATDQKAKNPTEVHIVGGVHPHRDLHYYGEMIQAIKEVLPSIHVKGFTAVELEFMIKKAQMPLEDGLRKLKEYGLDSLPGGGAEIFAHEVRSQICDDKASSESWLTIHETAHKVGLPSNATMLYGHIENYAHRVDHMAQLRALQDKTGGFNTFIPLKYRSQNNGLSHLGEVNTSEDLRNYAVSRLFLDNFPHIKAYWPMIGKGTTQLSLSFGVNDIDGTIDDSTKIYSMAGVEDKNPALSTADLVALVKAVGRQAIERDTVYNELVAY